MRVNARSSKLTLKTYRPFEVIPRDACTCQFVSFTDEIDTTAIDHSAMKTTA